MTTIDASPLTDALQSLVDARLDTIDRMLLGRVNRQDRLSIVREVESQIFDLLQGRDGESLDRDDVLAVLARLDPPEAYLPEEGAIVEARVIRPSTSPRISHGPTAPPAGRPDLIGGILGIVSIVTLAVGVMLGIALQSVMVYFGALSIALITGILAIVFAARAKLRGAWAVVGLVIGILVFIGSIAAALLA